MARNEKGVNFCWFFAHCGSPTSHKCEFYGGDGAACSHVRQDYDFNIKRCTSVEAMKARLAFGIEKATGAN